MRDPAERRRRRLREGRERAGARGPGETWGLGSGAWGSSSKTETQSPGPVPDSAANSLWPFTVSKTGVCEAASGAGVLSVRNGTWVLLKRRGEGSLEVRLLGPPPILPAEPRALSLRWLPHRPLLGLLRGLRPLSGLGSPWGGQDLEGPGSQLGGSPGLGETAPPRRATVPRLSSPEVGTGD